MLVLSFNATACRSTKTYSWLQLLDLISEQQQFHRRDYETDGLFQSYFEMVSDSCEVNLSNVSALVLVQFSRYVYFDAWCRRHYAQWFVVITETIKQFYAWTSF